MAKFIVALLFLLIACIFLGSVSADLATATKCPKPRPCKNLRLSPVTCLAIIQVTVYYKDGTSGPGIGGCFDPCTNLKVIAWEPIIFDLNSGN